jgi:hypothetical protein
MKKEKNICCGHNRPSASGVSGVVAFFVLKDRLKCTSKATMFENNKWYCKRHAPSKIEEREEKKWGTYIKKISRNNI